MRARARQRDSAPETLAVETGDLVQHDELHRAVGVGKDLLDPEFVKCCEGLARRSGKERNEAVPQKSIHRNLLHAQSVPGARNICRVIVLACVTLGRPGRFTVYAKLALLPLANVIVNVPTGVVVTFAGENGTALNAGPVVRINCPLYTPGPVFGAVTDNHSGVPSKS